MGRRLPGWPGLRIYGFPMWQRRSPAIWYPLQYLAFFAWALFVVSGLALRRRYDVVQVDNIPDLLVFSTLVPRLRRMPIVFFMYELMPEMTATRLSLGASDRGLRLVYALERAATGGPTASSRSATGCVAFSRVAASTRRGSAWWRIRSRSAIFRRGSSPTGPS